STLTALGRPSVDVTAAMGGGRSDDDRGAAVSFRHLHFITSISGHTLVHLNKIQFVFEVLALVPFEFVAYYVWGFNAIHLVRVVKLLRLSNLNRTISAFKTLLAQHNLLVMLHNIAKGFLVGLALFNLVFFHVIGCSYMFLAHVECGRHLDLCGHESSSHGSGGSVATEDVVAAHRFLSSGGGAAIVGPTCWAIQKQLADLNLFSQYIRTMLIVTYGDATSFTYAERCFSIGIQFARALMSCALIGGFELVYGHQNTNRAAYIALVEDAREYSRSRNLPAHLRDKVLGYFDYFWRVQQGLLENNIIAKLPIHFQTQCIDELKAKVIAKVHFLSHESTNIVQNLATRLTSQVFMPLDWITKTTRLREMYFISRGRVVLVDKYDNISFKLNQGDTFGDIALFVEGGFEYKALAETFCELYQLNRDIFEGVMDGYYGDAAAADAKRNEMREAVTQRDHQLLKTQKLLGQKISLKMLLDSHDNRGAGKWMLPNSKFRTIWSVLYLLTLIYIATEVPYKLIFSNAEDVNAFLLNELNYASAMTIELFHLVHIRLTMRHFAFEDKSSIVTTAPVVDPDLILARYKESGNLWWDVAAVLPVALAGDLLSVKSGLYVEILRGGRLLRLFRLRYFQEVLSEVLEAYHVSTSMQTVVYLSLGVLLVTHIAGCFWFFIADVQVSSDFVGNVTMEPEDLPISRCLLDGALHANCTWYLYDSVHYPDNDAYPRSLFWSVMTLTSVGYGMIFPFTTAECVYAFVWFYLSSLINFGVIGAISSAIAQLMANENRSQDTLLLINRFMKYKGVSPTVQTDIRRYYKNQWVREKGVNEDMFLSVLPDNVQHEILTFLHADTLKHVAIFDKVSDECKQIIASIIRHESYQTGDTILHAGDMGSDLYILRSGTVELRVGQTPMRILHPGDSYGEYNFVLEVPYTANVQAMEPTELSVMRRNEFEQVMKFFPDEWDNIYGLAHGVQAQETSLFARMQENFKRDKLVNLMQSTVTLFATPARETGVIPPQHPFRHGWNCLLFVAILYNLVMVVFRIAFLPHPSSSTLSLVWTLNLVFDAVYAVDIYLNYSHFTVDLDGFVRLDMADSRAHYRAHLFKRDMIASLPTYYIGDATVMAWCRLPRLARLLDLGHLVSLFQLWLQERIVSAKLTAFLRLANLLLILIVVAHFTGAVFYYLGDPLSHNTAHEGSSEEWFVHDSIIHEYPDNAVVAYIRSFYWALTTVTALDYRDIHPASNIETYYTCLACFAGFFFVGQVIGQLTSIIVHMDKVRKEANDFVERIENFDEYARSQNLPLFLLERGHQYFEFQFDCTRGMEADVIFSELPHTLRMKLFYDLYGHRLRGLPLFYNYDGAALANIAERLVSVLFLPHDNIIVEGGTGAALFIMNQGRAEEYVRQCNLVVAAVHEGSLFGEAAFFLPNTTHITSVRAVTCCEVLRLEKVDWIGLWRDSRRAALERAMYPALQDKNRYMLEATQNIMRNLVLTDKSIPHAKVRKQLMSNLRRMSTYGEKRMTIFKQLKLTTEPMHDKFGRRKRADLIGNRARLKQSSGVSSTFSESESGVMIKPKKDKKVSRGPIKSSFKRENPGARSMKSTKLLKDKLKSVQMIYASDSYVSETSSRESKDESSVHSFGRGDSVGANAWGAKGSAKVLPILHNPDDDDADADLEDDDVSDAVVLDEQNEHFQHLTLLRRMSMPTAAPVATADPTNLEMASIWGDLQLPPNWTRPRSTFRRTWDVVMLVGLLYYSVSIPMRACFVRSVRGLSESESLSRIQDLIGDTSHTLPLWLGLEYLVDTISLVDFTFRWFFFGQMIRGEVSIDLKQIRHYYRTKGGLYFDIAASLPIELVGLAFHDWASAMSICRFNKLFRLCHVSALNTKVRDTVTLHFKSIGWLPRVWSFLQVCSIFLLTSHWVACVWFYICLVGGHNAFYLTTSEYVVGPHTYHGIAALPAAYVKSFYYAMTSLTSITFGDLSSTSLGQTLASIAIIFISLTAYGVLTGGLSEIFEVELKNRVKFEEQTTTVSTFLMHRHFPRHLTIQILEYFRNMWEHSEGVVEAQALAPLSSALREDIAVYVKRDLITKVHLFSECDQDFTRAIVSVLQAEFFVGKDVIIREGDYERSMYFIHSGFVLVTNAAKSYEVIKQKGDYFGEMSLLHNTPRSGSCSAISNCDMYILDHDSYEYVLERFPHYRERNLRKWCTAPPPKQPGGAAASHVDAIPAAIDAASSLPTSEPSSPTSAGLHLQSLSDHEHMAVGDKGEAPTVPFDEGLLRRSSQIVSRDGARPHSPLPRDSAKAILPLQRQLTGSKLLSTTLQRQSSRLTVHHHHLDATHSAHALGDVHASAALPPLPNTPAVLGEPTPAGQTIRRASKLTNLDENTTSGGGGADDDGRHRRRQLSLDRTLGSFTRKASTIPRIDSSLDKMAQLLQNSPRDSACSESDRPASEMSAEIAKQAISMVVRQRALNHSLTSPGLIRRLSFDQVKTPRPTGGGLN
ncbi:hypothetical protein As57867_016904, partial [Aphanomyces stellatus]